MHNASSEIAINLPESYEGMLGDGRIMVEHARLNGRFVETVVALAVKDLLEGGTPVIFTPDRGHKVKHLVATTLQDAGFKVRKFRDEGFFSFRLQTGAELWVCVGESFHKEELPFTNPTRLYALNAHMISQDLLTLLPLEDALILGELAERGHWFYERSRAGALQLDAETITEIFPEQKQNWMETSDPFYERAMLLKDVEPVFSSQAFVAFSRKRLFIRTDKPLEILTPRQREQGKSQYGTPVVSFEVSPLQRRYLAQKRLAVRQGKKPWFLLLKYRRGGFTTLEQAMSYQTCVQRPRSDVMTLAHTMKSMRRIFRIAHIYHEKDPEQIRLKDPNKGSLEFVNGSYFFIGTAGGTGEARGDTLQRAHGSEVAKWCPGPNQLEDVQDLVAGITGAASNGEIVLETTPNGHEWFANEYKLAKDGNSLFTPIFLRWFDDPFNRLRPGQYNEEEILDTLSESEKALIQHEGLDISQIAFRREKQKEYKRLFPQEMPEDDVSCFLQSGVCYFDTDIILDLLKNLDEKCLEIQHPGGYERRWKAPEKGRSYVAGVDTSEGLPGCDRNGVGILDKESGEQVAALHGFFNPKTLAEHAVRMCREYNEAMLGVERNNHGHAVIQRVIGLGYDKPHFRGGPLFYFDQKQEVKKSRPGWDTNEKSRDIMLDNLHEAVQEGHMVIHDRDFLEECTTFRLQPSGRFEHDPGAHDDTLFKWGIAWQMRKYVRPKPKITVLGG